MICFVYLVFLIICFIYILFYLKVANLLLHTDSLRAHAARPVRARTSLTSLLQRRLFLLLVHRLRSADTFTISVTILLIKEWLDNSLDHNDLFDWACRERYVQKKSGRTWCERSSAASGTAAAESTGAAGVAGAAGAAVGAPSYVWSGSSMPRAWRRGCVSNAPQSETTARLPRYLGVDIHSFYRISIVALTSQQIEIEHPYKKSFLLIFPTL